MDKLAFARSWDEYVKQGPDYKAVADFWNKNAHKFPGYTISYWSWVRWYNKKKREDWLHKHQSPKFVLEEMNRELAPEEITDPEEGADKPVARLHEHKGRIRLRSGVDTIGSSTESKDFIRLVGAIAGNMSVDTPEVTSGYRSPYRQARAMANNWGKRGGTSYLIKLYGKKKIAKAVGEIFETYGNKGMGIRIASKYLENNPISSHQSGDALDFSFTRGIEEVLGEAKKLGARIKVLKEKDHYHVKVYRVPKQLMRVASLLELLKLANSN